MLPGTYQDHFRLNFQLAYPVVLSQLGHIMVNVADNVMVGQLGTLPLAAASLANSIFTVLMVFGMGISFGITPLVAQAAGRRKNNRISLLLLNGVLVCTITGILLYGFGTGLGPLYTYLGQPPAVLALARPYLNILFLSLIPLMVFQGFKQFGEGLSLTRQAMYLSVFANLLNVLGNYVFMYGKLGLPALGMNGAALSTLISRVLMALLLGYFILRSPRLQEYHLKWRKKYFRFRYLKRLVSLGLPISGQMLFEVAAFSASAIMIGWVGAREMAAHQIAINIASVTYMMASGLASASTIRVGTLAGQGNRAAMRLAGYSSFIMVFVFMLTAGLILVVANHIIPTFYSQDPEVIELAAGLLVIGALFQISDGIQVVGLGNLRGLEDVKIPGLVSLLAYWIIGLPVGYWLCFKMGFGINGVWSGLLIGLSIAALLLFFRFKKLSALK